MHSFKRHKFNIFPEAGAEDFARLVDDMRANGYDAAMPITLYQGAIRIGPPNIQAVTTWRSNRGLWWKSASPAGRARPVSGVTTCCGCGRTRGGFACCRSQCFAASSLTTGALGAMNTRRAGSSRRAPVAAITVNVYSSHDGSFGPRFTGSLAAT